MQPFSVVSTDLLINLYDDNMMERSTKKAGRLRPNRVVFDKHVYTGVCVYEVIWYEVIAQVSQNTP